MGTPPGRRPAVSGGEHEPPPLVGTWPRAYALVVAVLILSIALLALLTRGCA
jgi:hypothetical protein